MSVAQALAAAIAAQKGEPRRRRRRRQRLHRLKRMSALIRWAMLPDNLRTSATAPAAPTAPATTQAAPTIGTPTQKRRALGGRSGRSQCRRDCQLFWLHPSARQPFSCLGGCPRLRDQQHGRDQPGTGSERDTGRSAIEHIDFAGSDGGARGRRLGRQRRQRRQRRHMVTPPSKARWRRCQRCRRSNKRSHRQ